jgi:hypothetical protein
MEWKRCLVADERARGRKCSQMQPASRDWASLFPMVSPTRNPHFMPRQLQLNAVPRGDERLRPIDRSRRLPYNRAACRITDLEIAGHLRAGADCHA